MFSDYVTRCVPCRYFSCMRSNWNPNSTKGFGSLENELLQLFRFQSYTPLALAHNMGRRNFSLSVHNMVSDTKISYESLMKHPNSNIHPNDLKTLQTLISEKKIMDTMKLNQFKKILKFVKKGYPIPNHLKPIDLSIIPDKGPVKHLTLPLRKTGGRNNTGRITVRHRGGGFKRRLRLIDTKRNNGENCEVIRFEHDPNRSAKIALVKGLQSNQLSYILPPVGLKENDIISNIQTKDVNGNIPLGTYLSLSEIPIGSYIFNIEIRPGNGGQLVRSAGTKARLVGWDSSGQYAIIELPSGKTKQVLKRCRACIGQVNNPDWQHRIIGSAGRNRNLGIRPTVRGVAMNPVDHPHGGGKGGRSKGHHSQSPWGKICK